MMSDPTLLRVLFWNTFLLKPRPIPGGPGLPAFGELAAPAVTDRAAQIGSRLAGRFDVVALAEAFDPREHAVLLDAWGQPRPATAVGPPRSLLRGPLGFASSGLFTLVQDRRIVRTATHRFTERGSYRYDADALANKGVLLVEVDLPGLVGNLEVYSTHLCWGTGLLPGPRAADPRRRHRVRMAQVDELVTFIERRRRKGNAVMLVGDMNEPAVAPNYPDGPTRQYEELCGRLGAVGLHDVWPELGTGTGPTCGAPTDEFADQRDIDDPDALVDRPGDGAQGVPGPDAARRERIDYAFVAEPDAAGVVARAQRIRRYAFPRAPGAPERARLPRLSDHLAIGVDVTIEEI